MNQFFYIADLDATHDWGYSADFLKEYTKNSNKPFVVSNMYNTKLKSSIALANQYDSFILDQSGCDRYNGCEHQTRVQNGFVWDVVLWLINSETNIW